MFWLPGCETLAAVTALSSAEVCKTNFSTGLLLQTISCCFIQCKSLSKEKPNTTGHNWNSQASRSGMQLSLDNIAIIAPVNIAQYCPGQYCLILPNIALDNVAQTVHAVMITKWKPILGNWHPPLYLYLIFIALPCCARICFSRIVLWYFCETIYLMILPDEHWEGNWHPALYLYCFPLTERDLQSLTPPRWIIFSILWILWIISCKISWKRSQRKFPPAVFWTRIEIF